MKKNKLLMLCSFLVPMFLFYLFSFFRFKSNFLYNYPDVYSQYVPLFKYLKGVFVFDNSIFYSFSKQLGGSMAATYGYYLSSPINIFLLLFDDILSFLNFITVLKIGLCGLCMYIYLCTKREKNYFINFLLSLCYALMGFNLMFINNIFWFDVIYILPIVMIGIDKIIKKDSPFIYVLTLCYAIICNFYMAFSLCIFSVIYFFYNISCIGYKKNLATDLISVNSRKHKIQKNQIRMVRLKRTQSILAIVNHHCIKTFFGKV